MIASQSDGTSVSAMDEGRRRMDCPKKRGASMWPRPGAPGIVCGEIGGGGGFSEVDES